jgi:drug/metabolite transporter (DMT)-like permease
MTRFRLSRNDGLLLVMTVIWGVNYSIVKVALREIPPLAFNSLRLGLASLLFLVTLAVCRRGPHDVAASVLPVFQRSRMYPRDWFLIAVFGLIGHFIYQICFLLAWTGPPSPTVP